jgi:hypothetical protein
MLFVQNVHQLHSVHNSSNEIHMYWQKMKRNFFKNEDVHSRNPQVPIFGHRQPMTLLRRELQLSHLKII